MPRRPPTRHSSALTMESPVHACVRGRACLTACLPACECRRSHRELRRRTWITDAEVEWHGVAAGSPPDWTDASRFLAYSLRKPAPAGGAAPGSSAGGLYIAFNSSHLAQVGGWVGVRGGGGRANRMR